MGAYSRLSTIYRGTNQVPARRSWRPRSGLMTAAMTPTASATSATAMIATLTKRIDGSSEKKMGGNSWGRREAAWG